MVRIPRYVILRLVFCLFINQINECNERPSPDMLSMNSGFAPVIHVPFIISPIDILTKQEFIPIPYEWGMQMRSSLVMGILVTMVLFLSGSELAEELKSGNSATAPSWNGTWTDVNYSSPLNRTEVRSPVLADLMRSVWMTPFSCQVPCMKTVPHLMG